MQNENRLVKLIHRFYTLFKLNFLSVFFLTIGLFFFTFQAVFKASLVVIKNIQEGNIDGYTSIRDYYMPVFKNELKDFKKHLIPSLSLIWLVSMIILFRDINSPIASIINFLFIYLLIIIIMHCLYSKLLDMQLENLDEYKASMMENLAYEFFMPIKLVYSIIIICITSFLSYKIPILNLVILPTLSIYLFYSINVSNISKFNEILKKRRFMK